MREWILNVYSHSVRWPKAVHQYNYITSTLLCLQTSRHQPPPSAPCTLVGTPSLPGTWSLFLPGTGAWPGRRIWKLSTGPSILVGTPNPLNLEPAQVNFEKKAASGLQAEKNKAKINISIWNIIGIHCLMCGSLYYDTGFPQGSLAIYLHLYILPLTLSFALPLEKWIMSHIPWDVLSQGVLKRPETDKYRKWETQLAFPSLFP